MSDEYHTLPKMSDQDHWVDHCVDHWVVDMAGRITYKNKPVPGPRVTINRVPKFMLSLRKEAYTPSVVYLGLFDRVVEQSLSHMEYLKVEAVDRMAQRLPREEAHLYLKGAVRSIVYDIRGCYEEEPKYEDETMAWIFTLDGCFVLEILRVLAYGQQWQQWDNLHPVFNISRIKYWQFDVLSDLLILENQIPMRVLIKLLEVETGSEAEAKKQLLRLLCASIIPEYHPFMPDWLYQTDLIEENLYRFEDLEKNQHILGLFQNLIVHDPMDSEEPVSVSFLRMLRLLHQKLRFRPRKRIGHHGILMASAADLHTLGISFRHYIGVPSKRRITFAGTFAGTTLLLPTIWISDNTELLLRNLMALEVCQGLTVISYYANLLNSLVHAEADVAVLRKAGIIQSSMGTDREVANMLNNLSKGINFNSAEDAFGPLKMEVNQWYRNNLEYKEKYPKLWRKFTIFWSLVVLVSAALPTLVSIWQKIR